MKIIISSVLILYGSFLFSQTVTALGFYEQGVKASNLKNNRLADSLFSLSADLEPHPDTYFNRATVRARVNDVKGYCEDMACSAAMGDLEALSLFCKNCGKVDTVLNKAQMLNLWQEKYSVKYKCLYFDNSLIGRYNSKNKLLGFGWALKPDTNHIKDSSEVREERPAEFPGGVTELSRFIKTNMEYPIEAREQGISGRVHTKFVINSFGYIENIEILKGVKNCASCDQEAIRLLRIMPRWQPASVNGKNVNCYFNLPLTFKIQ